MASIERKAHNRPNDIEQIENQQMDPLISLWVAIPFGAVILLCAHAVALRLRPLPKVWPGLSAAERVVAITFSDALIAVTPAVFLALNQNTEETAGIVTLAAAAALAAAALMRAARDRRRSNS